MKKVKANDTLRVLKNMGKRNVCKYGCVLPMIELEGKKVKVSKVRGDKVYVKEDKEEWVWNIECFEEFYKK